MKDSAVGFVAIVVLLSAALRAEERFESFDRDPGWDAHNNRSDTPQPREVRQDFGYSRSKHAGGEEGEFGGFINPAAEPAYYAKRIPAHSFEKAMSASGKVACEGRHFNVLLGFFNAGTLNEWRTPNTIALRLYGRGDVFYAYVEYATSRWRAGGDSPGGFATVRDPETGRPQLAGFAARGAVHTWSLSYDPAGNGSRGSITATIDGQTAVCHLDEGHKQDRATFNRFGLVPVLKSYDDGGELWVDDVTINGQRENFDRDPGWDAFANRRTYITKNVRPRFDFGFSPTQFAGGENRGELGGTVFRGDIRVPEKMAYYGDRVEGLTLDKPLRASGKVSMRRGISDSTTLIGFFHSEKSTEVSESQASGFPMNFFGAAIEGPSRDGFLFYPVYRLAQGVDGYSRDANRPHILPDGASHEWSLEYDPQAAGGSGRLAVAFDGERVPIDLGAGHRHAPAAFDRFGIVTTWIDGNSQQVYLDDLSYTWRQE